MWCEIMPRKKKPRCGLCGVDFTYDGSWLHSEFCLKCDLALFQIEEALDMYIRRNPPGWIRKALTHVGWIFESYPRTAAYLNLATELMFGFVIEGENSLDEDELTELRYMRISPNAARRVLEAAFVIEKGTGPLLPGPLVMEITNILLVDFRLTSPDFTSKVKEVRGVLAVALTLALIEEGNFTPQRPLSLFRIFAQNIINSGLDDSSAISEEISARSFDDACIKLTPRQRTRLKWHMAGFSTGSPSVIERIDDDMSMVFDSDILIYMDRMRERYRERLRSREREG